MIDAARASAWARAMACSSLSSSEDTEFMSSTSARAKTGIRVASFAAPQFIFVAAVYALHSKMLKRP